ncbi:MAG: ribosomal protein S18-alanine N-acetyltransferase [Acutalibacteraceae bacterium]|nr:ribosomal protein S18-alanine N-acetyltransferase [Acutalibacteraceae bacterium]
MNILFVCTGNTCRSPMAEGYLRSKGIDGVTVSSRGLVADGSPVSPNSKTAMAEVGIDIAAHISRQITAGDINKADKIICLSPSHKSVLLSAGVPADKLFVLGNGISDPFGGDISVYRRCRDEIFTAVDKLIEDGFFGNIRIVSLEPRHIKEIARLEELCFSEPWSEEGILESYRLGTRFFVAEADRRIAGYIGIKAVIDEGYITNIAVFPELRRKGIAKALLNKVFEFAKEKELSFVSLEVRPSNTPAVSLYQKTGFKEEGRRKDFYRLPREDALIMTKRFSYEDSGD